MISSPVVLKTADSESRAPVSLPVPQLFDKPYFNSDLTPQCWDWQCAIRYSLSLRQRDEDQAGHVWGCALYGTQLPMLNSPPKKLGSYLAISKVCRKAELISICSLAHRCWGNRYRHWASQKVGVRRGGIWWFTASPRALPCIYMYITGV